MDKMGYIEIKVTGTIGNLDLSPDNYDIREIIPILENVEHLLYPGEKRDRPTISYKLDEGSVRHLFKTSIQHIIGFNAIIGQVNQLQSIDFLDLTTAKAFENIQGMAAKKDFTFSISTSLENSNEVLINRTTAFYRSEAIWADAEFYFYGRITSAGGKDKASIHIHTDEFGIVRIQTPISFLEQYHDNILYKTFGIRAIGKQHSETGELDTSALKFIDLVDYQPKYDEKYLKTLREKAKQSWLGAINANEWLNEIRGSYDS